MLLALCGGVAGRPAAITAMAAAIKPDPLATLRSVLKDRYPDVRAVLIRRGDCAVFAYYKAGVNADTRLPLHSMTKSVLSLLLGLAKAQGALSFDQTLGDLLPEVLAAGVDPKIRTIKVRHLVTMTAGLDAEAKPKLGLSLAEMWHWSLTRPILSAPGQEFRYDNYGANLLSVILSRRLGQSAEAFAFESLFGPMGISNEQWLDDGDGHSMGAYGLWLTAPDMVKIGLLYLRHGRWSGRQLVPEDFLIDATRTHNAGGPPFYAAYGDLLWIKPTTTGLAAYFAAGSDGQLIYVVPQRDLVVVLASDKSPPGGSLGFVNDVLLPVAASSTARACVAG